MGRIQRAKERVDLRRLVPGELVQERTERYLTCRCPFHDDQRASLLIFADGGVCLGCGWKGSALDWVMARQGVSLMEAVCCLEGRPEEVRTTAPRTERPVDFDDALPWYWHLSLNPTAVSHFETRGITKVSMAKFLLGWGRRFPSDPYPRLVLPRFWAGKVVGVKFRRVAEADDGSKYIAYPGFSDRGLWTPDQGAGLLTGQVQEALITEGELDAVIGNQLGLYTVSPTGGARMVKPEWTEQLRGVPRLWLVRDNDPPKGDGPTPGEEFAREVVEQLPHTTVVVLPEWHKDLSEFAIAGHGADDLAKLMREGRLRRVKTIMKDTPSWIAALTRPRGTGPRPRTPSSSNTLAS